MKIQIVALNNESVIVATTPVNLNTNTTDAMRDEEIGTNFVLAYRELKKKVKKLEETLVPQAPKVQPRKELSKVLDKPSESVL